MITDILFSIEGLRVAYAKPGQGGKDAGPGAEHALELDSLEIAEGGTTALLGPNGSGKTTLLKAMNGLLRPREGRILFRGEAAAESPRLRAESVYLHQTPYIMAGTVSYNVSYGARIRGASKREAAARAREAMAALGLEGFGGRGHRALSGGEAQRVGFARALATGACVFLLDEPTASVDSASRTLIVETVRRLSADGATIIIATHDQEFADLLGARKITLDSGRVVDDRSRR